ncbi:type II toxin-antitoxin system VapB family antitoxin [Ciceribacter sp. L1K22]|uniref:type II toxin-antitoxin system VapB family antitoxin n=1 Tax=Ciceribacter sp. L1K22 TaxID=2820275 RepID=UPI001ABEC8D3|nr:type II toxin-antitoxin system VapB family antitoxin [Ciceribacter sp. L1K22]MBO3759542.1 type II toxin-antitoxin system VapB family antitoxin [Ciceribacter sp. L1K22]
MRTTVTLDDDLVARAQEITGIKERSVLLKEALTRLIQDEAARRLIMLGGSAPDLEAPPRRRWNLDGTWGGSDWDKSE